MMKAHPMPDRLHPSHRPLVPIGNGEASAKAMCETLDDPALGGVLRAKVAD